MKPQAELKVVMVPTDELVMYEGNAKLHPAEQIDQIASSIEEFNFADPIAAWHNEDGESVIIEGHGRLMAAKKLGIEELPVIYLDYMSDEQRRAYTLVHNKLTMNSDFDIDMLSKELDKINSIDMGEFGFLVVDDDETELSGNPYTKETKIPQYEVESIDVAVEDLYSTERSEVLEGYIRDSEGITDEEKAFLNMAAKRHVVFDYRKIAEYYAQASPEMQRLMEQSALVIIDVDDAIANGYAKLTKNVRDLREDALNA